MTYSYVDFTDDIIEALGAHIPARCADSPSDQADICLEHIGHLQESRMVLLAALKEARERLALYAPHALPDVLTRANAAIKLAETPPERWPDEEDETLYRIEITKPGDEKPYLIFEHRLDDDVAAAKRLYGYQGDKVEAIEEEA